MAKIIAGLFILMLCTSCSTVSGDESAKEGYWMSYPASEWKVYAQSDTCMNVTYSEKYGATKTVQCMAVFETKTEYRLIGCGTDKLDLQKSNVVSIQVQK